MSGERSAGPDSCRAIARALGVSEVEVFRRAGIMSPLPPAVANEEDAMLLFRRIPAEQQPVALSVLSTLATGSVSRSMPVQYSLAENARASAGRESSQEDDLARGIDTRAVLLWLLDQVAKLAEPEDIEMLVRMAKRRGGSKGGKGDRDEPRDEVDGGVSEPAPGGGGNE